MNIELEENERIDDLEYNGLKIIQFSDLHYGSTIYKENLSSIKRIINERKPDIIIFTGDLIDNKYKMTKKDNDILTNTLKQLKSTLGKYSIIGDEDKDDISTIYNQADFTILKNGACIRTIYDSERKKYYDTDEDGFKWPIVKKVHRIHLVHFME